MKKGLFATSAIACALVAGLSMPASAATMLETIEQAMAAEGAPPGAFTYDTVVSDTDTSFELEGVRIEPEPGQGVVTIDRLKVDAMDMTAMETDGMPQFLTMAAEGFHLPPEAMDADSLEVFPGGMTFDMAIDYNMDKATNGLDLRDFSFAVDGYGSISLSLQMAGISEEAIGGMMFMGPEALMGNDITIEGFSLTLDDEGGLAQLYEMLAADEGVDVDTFVSTMLVPQMQMMGMMFAADPIASGVVAALTRFVGDYANPGGPLVITAEPPSPVSLMSLMGMADPTGLSSMLGLSATYEGTGGEGEGGEGGGSLFQPDEESETESSN